MLIRSTAYFRNVLAMLLALVASCTAERAGFAPGPTMLNCDPSCENGGTCTGTVCDCTLTDFSGPSCADRVDDCIGIDCMNGGSCVDENRTFSCECVETWAPDADTGLCTVPVTTCTDSDPCLNGGICTDIMQGAVDCDCTGTGYEGEFCQTDLDECMEGTATCDPTGTMQCANTAGSYTCVCNPSFAGDDCDACVTGHALPTCTTCAAGFIDSMTMPGKCVDDPCDPDPCTDFGGTCTVTMSDQASCDCNNDVIDGQESDRDCGGSECIQRCNDGLLCNVASDCISNDCGGVSGRCECGDGIKNSIETGVDCGGPSCPGCSSGEPCNVGSDCMSGSCGAAVPGECD